nr:SIS domain-containing protein [Geobacteraceae bacterium]
MKDRINAALRSHREVMDALQQELTPKIIRVASMLIDAFRGGNKLLVMGNGGSAADAQHLAGEIVGRFRLERPGLPAL